MLVIFSAVHTHTHTPAHRYSPSCLRLPHYTKKHLSKGATPACQGHGLKPPDHWCRWMVMDNRRAWGEGDSTWECSGGGGGGLECHSDVHAEALALRGTRSLTPRISHTVTSNTARLMCKGFICYLHTLSLSLSLSLCSS